MKPWQLLSLPVYTKNNGEYTKYIYLGNIEVKAKVQLFPVKNEAYIVTRNYIRQKEHQYAANIDK